MLGPIVVSGLVTGGIYSLLAVGFALIFSVARIINMGHTGFYMLAAFLVFIGTKLLHFSVLVSAICAVAIAALVAIGYFKGTIERVKQHELAVLLITIAFAILLQEIFLAVFSARFQAIDPFLVGYIELAGVRVAYQYVFALATSFLVLGVLLWLLKSKIGVAIRAVAQDPEIANAMGIDDKKICLIVMGISAGLAALAAILIAPIVMVHPYMWTPPLVVVLSAVVLGGLGSITGSIVGAFILGFVEVIVVNVVPEGTFLRGVASLLAMIIVLVVRPEGLFGIVFEEERL